MAFRGLDSEDYFSGVPDAPCDLCARQFPRTALTRVFDAADVKYDVCARCWIDHETQFVAHESPSLHQAYKQRRRRLRGNEQPKKVWERGKGFSIEAV